MVNEYLEYFPEFKEEFDGYRKDIEKTTMKLFNNYKEAYIFKNRQESYSLSSVHFVMRCVVFIKGSCQVG